MYTLCSGSRRAETVGNHDASYTKTFPEVSKHFVHDDVGVTKMVGSPVTFCFKKSLLANFIAEPVDVDCGALLQDVQAKCEG